MKQSNNETIKVTISLLNYNKKKYLKYCLDSILNQTHQDLEIFIIDNASTDGSQEFIESYLSNIRDRLESPIRDSIREIYNNTNLGYSKAHNQIIQKSTGKYILCLNPMGIALSIISLVVLLYQFNNPV